MLNCVPSTVSIAKPSLVYDSQLYHYATYGACGQRTKCQSLLLCACVAEYTDNKENPLILFIMSVVVRCLKTPSVILTFV